jgi:hypothetical protein
MFTIDDKQTEQIEEWRKTHDCELRTDTHGIDNEIYVGAIGGAITYCFTPTGLGMCLVAKCACGKSINVTNFDNW